MDVEQCGRQASLPLIGGLPVVHVPGALFESMVRITVRVDVTRSYRTLALVLRFATRRQTGGCGPFVRLRDFGSRKAGSPAGSARAVVARKLSKCSRTTWWRTVRSVWRGV